MGVTGSLLVIALLLAVSAFFSIAEISLAASRRLRLRQMAEEGNDRARRVLEVQEQPGNYFTVVQIGLNAVAILAGIVGEGTLTPQYSALLEMVLEPDTAQTMGFVLSFLTITTLFILFADLFPKRASMTEPERLAMLVAVPMQWCMTLFKPVVWVFSSLTTALIQLFGLPAKRDDRITHDDILALTEAGAEAGLLAAQEQQVIENVFELDTRTSRAR